MKGLIRAIDALSLDKDQTAIVSGIAAYFFMTEVRALIPYALAFSASSFFYIALADLIPEMHKKTRPADSLLQIVLIISGIMIIYFGLILTIAAAMWGSDIITKEERDKTVEFALTLPVTRSRLISAKAVAAPNAAAVFSQLRGFRSVVFIRFSMIVRCVPSARLHQDRFASRSNSPIWNRTLTTTGSRRPPPDRGGYGAGSVWRVLDL